MLLYFQKNSIVNLFLERFWAACFHFLSHCDSVCPPILSLTTLVLNVFHYSIVQERYEAYWIKGRWKGISLVVGWLGLCLPMWGPWVQFLVEELGSYMLHSQETKTWSRSNIEEIQLRPGKKKKETEMSNSNICDGICGFNSHLLLPEILLDSSFGYEFHKKSLKYRYLWLA